jgi:hypothetical protein
VPVDPSILYKYDPPAPPPKPRRDGLRALGLFGLGVLASAGALAAGWNNAAAASVIVGAVLVLSGLALAALVVVGWREDGVLGVYYRLRHPFGTALAADDRPGWLAHAAVAVLAILWLVAVLLMSRHPATIPWNLRGAPPAQSTRP